MPSRLRVKQFKFSKRILQDDRCFLTYLKHQQKVKLDES